MEVKKNGCSGAIICFIIEWVLGLKVQAKLTQYFYMSLINCLKNRIVFWRKWIDSEGLV